MAKLSRDDLFTLEAYAEKRKDFRAAVLEHKKHRAVHLGENATLYFEDQLTMQYQIQEMLRIEKIFEAEAIQEELDAYNPLIPDGCNWKATFMMEYADEQVRRVELTKLVGIEDKTWVQVEGFDKVFAISDEDLERSEQDKTSAVHFMRFELTTEMAAAVKQGAAINAGIDHENYQYALIPIADSSRESLVKDLD
jgi:hypothetical protein